MKTAWIAASSFLILAGAWFALMEFVLRHPGYTIRASVAGLIVLQGALSLLYLRSHQSNALRRTIALGAICGIALGVYAGFTTLRRVDFEGYILLIALGLIAHGALALAFTLARPGLRTV